MKAIKVAILIAAFATVIAGAQPIPQLAGDFPLGSLPGDAAVGSPELSARGKHKVGVKTLIMVNSGQLDVVRSVKGKPELSYDRTMTIEVWYPAALGAERELARYAEHLGRADQPGTLIQFTFVGRAARDAAIDSKGGPFPLLILSHGYPGSRYLMSHLAEHLASRGYVVAAIGHADSTYEDVAALASTLVNRSADQRFVTGEMLALSARDPFWKGSCDAGKVGLIGYSMGGYGALRSLGAGANEKVKNLAGEFGARVMAADSDAGDPRIKAAVLFAPWGGTFGGGPTGLWDQASLSRIRVPTLWIAGSKDDISGYAGIVALYESARNSTRYLLTYENALHNVAPLPAPPEAATWAQASRWADPVWDSRRVAGVNMHFLTAFFDRYLKNDEASGAYLDVKTRRSDEGVFALNKDGTKAPAHTYWPGFQARTALGLALRFEPAER